MDSPGKFTMDSPGKFTMDSPGKFTMDSPGKPPTTSLPMASIEGAIRLQNPTAPCASGPVDATHHQGQVKQGLKKHGEFICLVVRKTIGKP